MDTVWIPVKEFRDYIWSFGNKANLEGIDGFTRWVITREDGSKYIARPESSVNPPKDNGIPRCSFCKADGMEITGLQLFKNGGCSNCKNYQRNEH